MWESAGRPERLKMELGYEFEDSRIARCRYGAESGAAEAAVGIIQRRRVRNVEGFSTEFEIHSLRDAECFADHEVGVLEARTSHGVARACADGELRSVGERRGVEEFRHRAPVEFIRVRDAVGALHGEAKARIIVRRLRNRDRIA